MGKGATGKKTVRRFAGGGFLDAVPGLSSGRTPGMAGVNPYGDGAGTTAGISGATYMTSTDASTALPVPGQQAIGQMPAYGQRTPATQSRRDSSPLGRLDQDIAMGNALGELSNTERYQMTNPDNQAYTIGQPQGRGRGQGSQPPMVGAAPGSSADASMRNQQTSLMSSLRDKLAEQPLYAGYAGGGEIKETAEQVMARMAAKYGTGGATPAAPVAAPAPKVQAQATQQAAKTVGGVYGALKNRGAQIDAAVNGYTNGGKIKGPGTPTSDSIQAKVTDTGEPIAVSTGERIVSKDQDTLLQKIAAGMGYDSLDAMLEAGTGKPVGPTIKAGMKHAFNGALLEQPREPVRIPPALISNGKIFDNANVRGPASGQIPPKADIAVLQERQQKAQVASALPSPTPAVTVAQPQSSNTDASNITESPGDNRGAETRFAANEQQIAMPSGAIQGKSSVNAAKMTAPDGGGYITNGAGKAMKIEANEGAWEDTRRYKDAIAQNGKDKELLAGMQRERLMRDMGADITSQGTRVAAAQQLAQMDKDQAMQLLAQRGQREDAMSGLDQQLKGQQIAQIADNNALQKKVIEGDPIAMEQWNRIHTKAPDQYINVPDGEEVDANGNVLRRPNRVISARTGQELARQTAQASPAVAVGTPVKAPDGTHTFQGKTITVKDGKVTGVK